MHCGLVWELLKGSRLHWGELPREMKLRKRRGSQHPCKGGDSQVAGTLPRGGEDPVSSSPPWGKGNNGLTLGETMGKSRPRHQRAPQLGSVQRPDLQGTTRI